MRAVWFEAFGRMPDVREVPAPQCPEAGAVIAVSATGLCRSDWHGWIGHDPTIALPHVPGHEFAGTVVEVGPQVRRCTVGQRVTVPFVCACGRCAQCLAGEQQVCAQQTQPGFTGWGSFAELVAIENADINIVELPAELDFVSAASLGCRFATSYRALTVHGPVGPRDWVEVHGCGGVGLSTVMIAARFGAQVIAVDVVPAALERAAELGAAVTVNALDMDVAQTIREVTGGGAAISLDALGSSSTCANSIASLRPRGRHVQIGLMVGADAAPPIPMGKVIAGELEIYGSHGMPAHSYPAMLADVAAGRLAPAQLVGVEIGLDDAPLALTSIDRESPVGMTVIRL